jgi:putative acetyltransferase
MIIRDEQDEDGAAIAQAVERAFGRADEAWLVERLRRDGDAAISLVAVSDDAVVGHVMLSPMSAPFRALGLAPLAVLPEFRERGIGAALTRAAIDRARAEGWAAVFVLGDPSYYGRFGFRSDLAAGFSSPYAGPHLMVLPLYRALSSRSGRIDYAPAFAALT